MTFALIGCLVLLTAGFLVLLDRKDKRAHVERAEQRRETQNLLQRIQAPELAVVQHELQSVEAPQPPQTDEEHWRLDEERRQAIAQLEAMENSPFDRV